MSGLAVDANHHRLSWSAYANHDNDTGRHNLGRETGAPLVQPAHPPLAWYSRHPEQPLGQAHLVQGRSWSVKYRGWGASEI